MSSAARAAEPARLAVGRVQRTPFEEFRHRFKRNRLAVGGLVVVILYIAMALAADLLFSVEYVVGNQISNAFAPVLTTAEVEIGGTKFPHTYILGADNFGRTYSDESFMAPGSP